MFLLVMCSWKMSYLGWQWMWQRKGGQPRQWRLDRCTTQFTQKEKWLMLVSLLCLKESGLTTPPCRRINCCWVRRCKVHVRFLVFLSEDIFAPCPRGSKTPVPGVPRFPCCLHVVSRSVSVVCVVCPPLKSSPSWRSRGRLRVYFYPSWCAGRRRPCDSWMTEAWLWSVVRLCVRRKDARGDVMATLCRSLSAHSHTTGRQAVLEVGCVNARIVYNWLDLMESATVDFKDCYFLPEMRRATNLQQCH